MSEIAIDRIGGNCPVQAEGTIDGKPFYFRARGEHWSMSIGGSDVVGDPEWDHEEDYGDWPSAGWMTEDEARAFIAKAADLYRAAPASCDGNPEGAETEGLRREAMTARSDEVGDALPISPALRSPEEETP